MKMVSYRVGPTFGILSVYFLFTTLPLLLSILTAPVESAPKGKPRFIAIPLEDVQLVEVEDLPDSKTPTATHLARAPRDVHSQPKSGSNTDPEVPRYERQANDHHHQYVDFGGHTGHHGSFGWYADFPVHNEDHK